MQEAIASALRLPLSRAVRSGTLLLFALCAACLLPTAAWAEIYGWTDSNGQVTYSNLPPPPGVHVTDVIHETPLSAKDVQQANYEAQIRALNDRIRLMELEETAKNRQVVDFAAPPPAPAGVGCGPGDSYDCNPDWGPYATTTFLGTGPYRSQWGLRAHQKHRGPVQPPPMHKPNIAGSPNKSSLAPR